MKLERGALLSTLFHSPSLAWSAEAGREQEVREKTEAVPQAGQDRSDSKPPKTRLVLFFVRKQSEKTDGGVPVFSRRQQGHPGLMRASKDPMCFLEALTL